MLRIHVAARTEVFAVDDAVGVVVVGTIRGKGTAEAAFGAGIIPHPEFPVVGDAVAVVVFFVAHDVGFVFRDFVGKSEDVDHSYAALAQRDLVGHTSPPVGAPFLVEPELIRAVVTTVAVVKAPALVVVRVLLALDGVHPGELPFVPSGHGGKRGLAFFAWSLVGAGRPREQNDWQ